MLDAMQCRTCLRALGSARQLSRCIFDASKRIGECEVLCADMLLACAALAVNKDDDLPEQICSKCFKKLCASYKFRQLCKESYSTLLQQRAQHVETIKTEIKEDAGNDAQHAHDYDSDGYTVPLDMEETDVLKKEEVLNVVKEEVKSDVDDALLKSEICDDPDYEIPLKIVARRKKKAVKTSKVKIKKERGERMSGKKGRRRKSESEMLKCTQCPRLFNFPYELLRHEEIHLGLKNYYCTECEKYYRNEKIHKAIHERPLKFICDTCQRAFNSRSKLCAHLETHNPNRPRLPCTEEGCNKTFISIHSLEKHKMLHSGFREFICHVCSALFTDIYQLNAHTARHMGDRKFKCRVCPKKFYSSSNRNSHEIRHSNNKNFQCHICDKSFHVSTSLKRHMLVHTAEMKYACRFCSKKFARLDNQKRHEVVMHGATFDPKTPKLHDG